MSSLTCITCQVRFHDADLHRTHFKGDWHRYNLKRKVANLSVVTAEAFEERRAAHEKTAKEGEGGDQKKDGSYYCVACGKSFKNKKAYENHLQSKKHQEMILKFEKTPAPLHPAVEEEEEEEDEEDMEVEEVDSDEWEDEPIEMVDCLFCPHHSSSLEKNLSHMTVSHSFFLPDPEFISNLEGLMCYLGAKVGQGHMCLWCDDKGKRFSSVQDVQRHMLDKGHCKLLHEADSLLEYDEWYDYSASYPDQENPEGEVDLNVLDDTGYELVLPSGTKVGHRSLVRSDHHLLFYTVLITTSSPQILQAESEPRPECCAGRQQVPTQPDVHLQVPGLDWLLWSGRRSQGRAGWRYNERNLTLCVLRPGISTSSGN